MVNLIYLKISPKSQIQKRKNYKWLDSLTGHVGSSVKSFPSASANPNKPKMFGNNDELAKCFNSVKNS